MYIKTFPVTASFCLIALICYGCGRASSNINSSTPQPHQDEVQNQNQRTTKSNIPKDPIEAGFLSDSYPKRKETWMRFTKDGRYRWARPEDFHIPEIAKNSSDAIMFAIQYPIVNGDLNHDGIYGDFAAIVIDTTQTDEKSYGLVIFNAPANKQQDYEPYWLYHKEDLSKAVIQAFSDVIYVKFYSADNNKSICEVKWDKAKGKYFCRP